MHITHISKLEFLCAFREAFFTSMTKKNIQGGFAGAGLVPYDPQKVLLKLDVLLRTPTPPATLPEIRQTWVSKTPQNAHEAASQSGHIKSRISAHQNSSPTSMITALDQFAKGATAIMLAHAAIQGTARPAHYFVLTDEVFRQRYKTTLPYGYKNVADIVEETTQALCYTFGRATRAVSICTPAYYADILCERARCYLSNIFDSPSQSAAGSVVKSEHEAEPSQEDLGVHENLKDTMFYI
jgi:hypothetical protein